MGVVEETIWGAYRSRPVYLYTLNGASGAAARVTNFGAILQSLEIPDAAGRLLDVVLGFDTLDEYLAGHPFFGATVGRYANRIAGGRFTLEGRDYHLAINDGAGPNHIHGGPGGFDKQVWEPLDFGQREEGPFVAMTYTSVDGEEGYPGTVVTTVTYTLTGDDELRISMEARTDQSTVVNLTNHSYWNLNGHQAGPVLDHEVTLFADAFTPVDGHLIPTGEIRPVAGTPFDFTEPKPIAAEMDAISQPCPREPGVTGGPGGYDHNFVLRDAAGRVRSAAQVASRRSGLAMAVRTDQPGVQFYTGNNLTDALTGKQGAVYGRHHGFCLETQAFPDAVNRQESPGWPSVILQPDDKYRHEVCYAFASTSTTTSASAAPDR